MAMSDTANPTTAGAAPLPNKKKPLPFKRIIVKRKSEDNEGSRPQNKEDEDDNDLDLFSRSKDYYDEFSSHVSAASKRAGKLPERSGRTSNGSHAKVEDGADKFPNGSAAKRRRINDEEEFERYCERYEDADGTVPGISGSEPLRRSSVSSISPVDPASPSSSTRSYTRIVLKTKGKEPETKPGTSNLPPTPSRSEPQDAPTTPQEAASSDDDPIPSRRTRSARKAAKVDATPSPKLEASPIIVSDDDDDGDDPFDGPDMPAQTEEHDEFAKYIELARKKEAAASKAAAEAAANSPGLTPVRDAAAGSANSQPASDPVYKIYIYSRVSKAAEMPPLLVQRKLSQNMKVVRDTWLGKAGVLGFLDPDVYANEVFLTWRDVKIYGTTTGLSLGLRTDAAGRLGMGAYGEDGYHNGGLVLEAWTEEDFQAYLGAKDRERRHIRGDYSDDDMEDGEEQVDEAPHGQEEKIRVILKARDTEPVNATAYASTPVEILIAAFRKQRKVDPARGIFLMFDGERLEEGTTVGDADIGDMHSVEVYIK